MRVAAILSLMLVVVASCGETIIDCGGPAQWRTITGELASMAEIVDADDGLRRAEAVIRDATGNETDVTVWGRPGRLVVGQTYEFHIDQYDEVTVELSGATGCGYDYKSTEWDIRS